MSVSCTMEHRRAFRASRAQRPDCRRYASSLRFANRGGASRHGWIRARSRTRVYVRECDARYFSIDFRNPDPAIALVHCLSTGWTHNVAQEASSSNSGTEEDVAAFDVALLLGYWFGAHIGALCTTTSRAAPTTSPSKLGRRGGLLAAQVSLSDLIVSTHPTRRY